MILHLRLQGWISSRLPTRFQKAPKLPWEARRKLDPIGLCWPWVLSSWTYARSVKWCAIDGIVVKVDILLLWFEQYAQWKWNSSTRVRPISHAYACMAFHTRATTILSFQGSFFSFVEESLTRCWIANQFSVWSLKWIGGGNSTQEATAGQSQSKGLPNRLHGHLWWKTIILITFLLSIT